MHSALSPKCKIDSLRVESLRREGKGHGFRQVTNSSSAVGNFLRLQTLFPWGGEGRGGERGASFRIWEKRSSFASLILTKGREGGKGGRSSGVVISWRPPLRQSLFLAIFHLLSLRLFVPPISPAIYSFLAPCTLSATLSSPLLRIPPLSNFPPFLLYSFLHDVPYLLNS